MFFFQTSWIMTPKTWLWPSRKTKPPWVNFVTIWGFSSSMDMDQTSKLHWKNSTVSTAPQHIKLGTYSIAPAELQSKSLAQVFWRFCANAVMGVFLGLQQACFALTYWNIMHLWPLSRAEHSEKSDPMTQTTTILEVGFRCTEGGGDPGWG